jgi:hypothetical protein
MDVGLSRVRSPNWRRERVASRRARRRRSAARVQRCSPAAIAEPELSSESFYPTDSAPAVAALPMKQHRLTHDRFSAASRNTIDSRAQETALFAGNLSRESDSDEWRRAANI